MMLAKTTESAGSRRFCTGETWKRRYLGGDLDVVLGENGAQRHAGGAALVVGERVVGEDLRMERRERDNGAAGGENGLEVVAEERWRGDRGVVEEPHDAQHQLLLAGGERGLENLQEARQQGGVIGDRLVVDFGGDDVAARFDGHRENLESIPLLKTHGKVGVVQTVVKNVDQVR